MSLAMPEDFRKKSSQAIHIVALPLSFLVFMLIYRPFSIEEQLQLGRFSFGVNLTLVSCILLGTTALMRGLFYLLRRRIDRLTYYFWCLLEISVGALFVALYVWLMSRRVDPYFLVVARAYGWIFPVLIFPYTIITLALYLNHAVRTAGEPSEGEKMRFYDDRNNLKLVVSVADVLAISAEENYIKVHYLAEGKLKSYLVRSSMKSIEDVCLQKGLVRCHRSHFLNPAHIKTLRKERERMIVAEMKVEGVEIPVTKRYYNDLVERL